MLLLRLRTAPPVPFARHKPMTKDTMHYTVGLQRVRALNGGVCDVHDRKSILIRPAKK